MDKISYKNGPTNAKPARAGSCKKKRALTTDSRAALSNGMKIYMDSLNAYSAKQTACKSCAKPAIRPKPRRNAENELIRIITQSSNSPFYKYTVDSITIAEPKNTNMKLEDTSKAPSIPSISGRTIRLSSLRPGDWLNVYGFSPGVDYRCYVVQNSELLKKVELCWPSGDYEVTTYETLTDGPIDEAIYMGRGHRRLWWKHLPKCARKYFAEYSKPCIY